MTTATGHTGWQRWSSRVRARRLPLVLIGVVVIARIVVAYPGWYAYDDFQLKWQAATEPLISYLFTPHLGLLMPLSFVVDRVRMVVSPGYGSAAAVSMIALGVAAVVMLRLLELLRVRGVALYFALAFFLLSPITSESTLWWAAALNGTLMLPFVLLVMVAAVRFAQGAPVRYLVFLGVAQVVALGFYVKAVMLPLWLLALALGVIDRERWRRMVAPVLVSAVVSAGYLGAALVGVGQRQAVNDFNVGGLVSIVASQITGVVLPSPAGGPWSWFAPAGAPISGYDRSAVAIVIGALVWILLVWRLHLARRLRVLLLLAVWIVTGAAVHVLGRGDPGWVDDAVHTIRYAADLIVPLTVTVGIALSPLPENARAFVRLRAADLRSTGVILTGAFVISAVLAWAPISSTWQAAPGRPWASTAQVSVDAASTSLGPLLYEGAPGEVVPDYWEAASTVPGALAGETTATWATAMVLPFQGAVPAALRDGTAGPSVIQPIFVASADTGCLALVRAGTSQQVLLNGEAPRGTWLTLVHARPVASPRPTQLAVAWVGGDPASVTLPSGDAWAYFTVRGGGRTVVVRAAGGDVCISSVEVGVGRLVQ